MPMTDEHQWDARPVCVIFYITPRGYEWCSIGSLILVIAAIQKYIANSLLQGGSICIVGCHEFMEPAESIQFFDGLRHCCHLSIQRRIITIPWLLEFQYWAVLLHQLWEYRPVLHLQMLYQQVSRHSSPADPPLEFHYWAVLLLHQQRRPTPSDRILVVGKRGETSSLSMPLSNEGR